MFRARSDASCNIAVRIQSQFAPKTEVAEFVGSFPPARHYSWSKKLCGYDATVAQMQCRRKNTFLSLSFENAENIINAFCHFQTRFLIVRWSKFFSSDSTAMQNAAARLLTRNWEDAAHLTSPNIFFRIGFQ